MSESFRSESLFNFNLDASGASDYAVAFTEDDIRPSQEFPLQDYHPADQNEPPPPIDEMVRNISSPRMEYDYFTNIENFENGPSYWKIKRKRKIPNMENDEPMIRKKRTRKLMEVPKFVSASLEDSGSEDRDFLSLDTTEGKRAQSKVSWRIKERSLKLPQINKPAPNDLFDHYMFEPSAKTYEPSVRTYEPNGSGNFPEEIDEVRIDNSLIEVINLFKNLFQKYSFKYRIQKKKLKEKNELSSQIDNDFLDINDISNHNTTSPVPFETQTDIEEPQMPQHPIPISPVFIDSPPVVIFIQNLNNFNFFVTSDNFMTNIFQFNRWKKFQ